jgi:hypothetical protein
LIWIDAVARAGKDPRRLKRKRFCRSSI